MGVLPRAWRPTRLPDMLCKIRLSWRVHLISSHLQTATALTDHGLFPGWESPALCSGQTRHLFTCSILNHLLGQILSVDPLYLKAGEVLKLSSLPFQAMATRGLRRRLPPSVLPSLLTLFFCCIGSIYLSAHIHLNAKINADGIDLSLGREVLQQVIKNVPLNCEKESAEMREAQQSRFAILTAGNCEC